MNFNYFLPTIILMVLYAIIYAISPSIGNWYHTSIYPTINQTLIHLTPNAKFSIGDFIYAFVGCFLVFKLFFYLTKKEGLKTLRLLINVSLTFLILFQIFWGINNYKIPLHEQLKLENEYSTDELYAFVEKNIKEINNLHILCTQDSLKKVNIIKDYNAFHKEAMLTYPNVWFLKNYDVTKLNEGKPSIYSYFLSKAGFSGYFNPFTHENQINDEIPTIGMPVTYIHELSHQLGFASEAEANFIAYYTLGLSDKLQFKYAANLYGLKYALKEVNKIDEEKFLSYVNQLNPGIFENIQEAEHFWKTNKNFSSNVFKPLYSVFLKANNQKHGIRSYNRMVNLMIHYDKMYGD